MDKTVLQVKIIDAGNSPFNVGDVMTINYEGVFNPSAVSDEALEMDLCCEACGGNIMRHECRCERT
jgi:hypothetical protein